MSESSENELRERIETLEAEVDRLRERRQKATKTRRGLLAALGAGAIGIGSASAQTNNSTNTTSTNSTLSTTEANLDSPCTWLGDHDADGHGLYDLGPLSFREDEFDPVKGFSPDAFGINGNDRLTVGGSSAGQWEETDSDGLLELPNYDGVDLGTVQTDRTLNEKRSSEVPDGEIPNDVIAFYGRDDNVLRSKVGGSDEMAIGSGPIRVDDGVLSGASEVAVSFSDTASRYELHLDDLDITSDSGEGLTLQISQDGGSTWESSGYKFTLISHDLTQSNSVNGTGGSNAQFAEKLSGGSGGSMWTIKCSYPADAANYPELWTEGTGTGIGGSRVKCEGHGRWNTAEAIDAMRVQPTGGTFDGIYRLYAVV